MPRAGCLTPFPSLSVLRLLKQQPSPQVLPGSGPRVWLSLRVGHQQSANLPSQVSERSQGPGGELGGHGRDRGAVPALR